MRKPKQYYLGGEISTSETIAGVKEAREQGVMRDNVGENIVDTCLCPDTGYWETAIAVEGDYRGMVPVSEYPSRDIAVVEHNKWVEWLKTATKDELKDLKDIHLANLGL